MSDHGYEKGRLNLPFVGICTFGKYPYQSDWNKRIEPLFDDCLLSDFNGEHLEAFLINLYIFCG